MMEPITIINVWCCYTNMASISKTVYQLSGNIINLILLVMKLFYPQPTHPFINIITIIMIKS